MLGSRSCNPKTMVPAMSRNLKDDEKHACSDGPQRNGLACTVAGSVCSKIHIQMGFPFCKLYFCIKEG